MELECLPHHVAIIMDGNGRWAQLHNKPRIWGHRIGAKVVDAITRECAKLGIGQLTLYAFSSENWQRPEQEVGYLMCLLRRFLISERKVLMENDVKLTTIGQTYRLPESVQREIEITKEMTKNNKRMILCLALSYGGRTEILDCTKNLVQKALSGEISIADIDEKLYQQHLYQSDMPELDLLIRTGGEMRLSNFLLWQVSYAELWVTPIFWPDFSVAHLHQALKDFGRRDRRFGKVPQQTNLPKLVASV